MTSGELDVLRDIWKAVVAYVVPALLVVLANLIGPFADFDLERNLSD